ncbi:MAG: hypothetical protein ACI9F9_001499 [Candidatus Paceibacteria bacterium]|jgi:hypothetical protein
MSSAQEHEAVEARLHARAERLGKRSLLSPAVADSVRATLRVEATRESRARFRKPVVVFALGLAAAAMLLLFAYRNQRSSLEDFGKASASIALLEPSGRVLASTPGLRSGEIQDAAQLESFLLELVAEESVAVAVRVKEAGHWTSPLGTQDILLQSGEEFLRSIPWREEGMTLLVILSQRPIPAERLDASLKASDGDSLEADLGCQVIEHQLSRAPLAK